MSVVQDQPMPMLCAVSVEPMRKNSGLTEYGLGIATQSPDGSYWAGAHNWFAGPADTAQMSEASALVVLHYAHGNVAAGELVAVLPCEGSL